MIEDTDDFLVSTNDTSYLNKHRPPLYNTWQVKRQTTIEKHTNIRIDINEHWIQLSNQKGIKALLQESNLADCNHTLTPHIDGFDLSNAIAEDTMLPTGVVAYQSIIRSLRYIADTTHPEIAFIVGLLGWHL